MKYASIEAVKENKILGPLFKYVKDLPSDFFKIPKHDYDALADILCASRYEDLDFTDPHLTYKLYAVALESKKPVTENMMVTGLMLAWAHQSFRDQEFKQYPFLQKYAFDDKSGPYQVDTISYIMADQSTRFKQQNKKDTDGGYYRINLPRKWMVTFLYDGLEGLFVFHDHLPQRKKFILWLKKYYERSKLAGVDNSLFDDYQFNQLLENPTRDLAKAFKKFMESIEPDLAGFLQIKHQDEITEEIRIQRDSIAFLVFLLGANEQSPSIEISPDFDKDNPGSPLLCLINLTVTSAIQLQSVLHDKDTTFPLFIAGPPSLALFSQSVCDAKKFGKLECRPVELMYLGLERAKDYHNYKADPYMAMWHDFMVHCFRNGSNPHKSLIRYLIGFLERLKNFPMSAWLWSLCDMNSSLGRIYRENLKELIQEHPSLERYNQQICRFRMKALYSVFGLLMKSKYFYFETKHFFEYLDENDTVLAILFDMNKNPETWQPLLKGHPSKDIFTNDNPFLFILCGKEHKKFLPIFNQTQQVADANRDKSIEFCIMAYRLRKYSVCWSLFQDIAGDFDVRKILKWNRNGGLYFKDPQSELKYELEEIKKPIEILEHFLPVLTQHREFKISGNSEKIVQLRQEIKQIKKRPPALELEEKSSIQEDSPILSGTPIQISKPSIIKQPSRKNFFQDDLMLRSKKPNPIVRSRSCPTLS